MFNKWVRTIHRWLAVPIMVVLVFVIGWSMTQGATVPPPEWIGGIGIVTMLSLLITGIYMFFQHHWAKWRRDRRNRSSGSAALNSGD